MFWNDPNLYGFKDVNTPIPGWQTPPKMFGGFDPNLYKDIYTQPQVPFMGPVPTPWQEIPRYLPQTYYGFQPQFVPPMAFGKLPLTAIHPYMQQLNMNLPLYNYFRPFIY